MPRLESEFFMATTILLLGQVFYSYVMGEISNQQAELGQDDLELQKKVDLTNSAMQNLQIDKNLRREVSVYILNTHSTFKKQGELTQFLKSISPSIRIKCTSLIFMKLVDRNVVLQTINKSTERPEGGIDPGAGLATHHNKDLAKIVAKMEVQLTMPEDIIVGQGDEAHVYLKKQEEKEDDEFKDEITKKNEKLKDIKFYIISRGRAEVIQRFSQQKDELPQTVRTLGDYDHFGEISLVYECRRTCSVRSKNYCTLAMISRPDYLELKREANLTNFEI